MHDSIGNCRPSRNLQKEYVETAIGWRRAGVWAHPAGRR